MKKIRILDRNFYKPISCLTAYSPSIAKILDGRIDLILVGDSLGSTLYGMKNTQGVTMNMMKNHGAAVNKVIKKSIKVLDMPYKTYENKVDAFKNAKILLNYCKPDLLKLEIDKKKLVILKHLVNKKVNIIDVGASDGIATKFFYNNLNTGTIFCVEPHPSYVKILRKINIKNIIVKPFAIGEKISKKGIGQTINDRLIRASKK